ncbi:GGDEF domain-containing protein [Trichothermofontia sp.]
MIRWWPISPLITIARRHFSDRKRAELERQQAAQELRLANERLAMRTRTDPLTQIANRRHFDEYLQKVWQKANEAKRQGRDRYIHYYTIVIITLSTLSPRMKWRRDPSTTR